MSNTNGLTQQTINRVSLFIAAKAREFGDELAEIGDFIRELNDCCLDRGVYFSLKRNGDTSALADCSLAFFMLCAITGGGNERIRELYRAARDSYSKTGKPRIVVYIKAGPDQTQDDANLLREQLGADIETFHSSYTHIDTVKLGILMQIKQLDIKGVDIRLEGGKALQGSEVLMPLDNVGSLTGYENLQNLKQKQAELEDRFYAAMARHKEDPDDAAAYDEYRAVSTERNTAIQQIRSIEMQLYHMLEGMYEQTFQGKLSKRQAESYKLVERGLLSEARDVLDFYSIASESRHDEEIAEQAAKRAEVHVNELMQLKDINAALLDMEGAEACYKEAVRLEEKHDLPRKATEYYVEFLCYQTRHSEATELAERLLQYYQTPGSKATNEDKSLMYNLLGIIYTDTQRMEEAERMLKASLEIRSARTEGDPDSIQGDIAVVFNGLGNLYYFQYQYEKSIAAHESALEIRLKLFEHNRARYAEYLLSTYGNLSDAYYGMHDYEKCAELLELELELYKDQFVMINYEKDDLLSLCYCNLGDAYAHLQRFAEAEEALKLALEAQLRLAESNPTAYELRVAETHRTIGAVYLRSKRYPEAEEQLKAAFIILNRLVRRSPEAFEKDLASCFFSYGELCAGTNRLAEAANALSSAITLFDKYKDSNPAFAEQAADAQKLLGSLSDTKRLSEGVHAGFTPEEQEIAMLLTAGATKREIVRKLGISAVEYSRRVSAIREKVSGMAEADPVIEAVADEYGLTRREADVLVYLRRGAGNDIITDELYISEETVRSHVRNVLKKLLIENRQDVARWLDEYANA